MTDAASHAQPRRQVPVLRNALSLGAPDLLAEIGDRLGLIVNCLNASGYRISQAEAAPAQTRPEHCPCGDHYSDVCSCNEHDHQ